MSFAYQNNNLCLVQGTQSVSLLELAKQNTEPFYVYDLDGLLKRLLFFKEQIEPAKVFYAMKANSHLKLLKVFSQENTGVDVVSGGEIQLALKAGFKGKDIVFSGVGKTKQEIQLALDINIFQFNVESLSELKRIGELARAGRKKTQVAFRMNPDIDAQTHPYITTGLRENKFGMDIEILIALKSVLREYSDCLSLQGLTLHIGSQIQNLKPLSASIQKMASLYKELQKEFNVRTLDVGGGLGIDYKAERADGDLSIIKEYGRILKNVMKDFKGQILTEPGRIITARFACLIGEIQYLKKTSYKNFVILNTGMHHLLRPCLYQAYHRILPLQKPGKIHKLENCSTQVYDIAGPICESSDILGRDRLLSGLKEGDFMAIMDAGAYGAVMANAYNTHPLPKEVFVSQGRVV